MAERNVIKMFEVFQFQRNVAQQRTVVKTTISNQHKTFSASVVLDPDIKKLIKNVVLKDLWNH